MSQYGGMVLTHGCSTCFAESLPLILKAASVQLKSALDLLRDLLSEADPAVSIYRFVSI